MSFSPSRYIIESYASGIALTQSLLALLLELDQHPRQKHLEQLYVTWVKMGKIIDLLTIFLKTQYQPSTFHNFLQICTPSSFGSTCFIEVKVSMPLALADFSAVSSPISILSSLTISLSLIPPAPLRTPSGGPIPGSSVFNSGVP